MMLEITEQEREVLLELLETRLTAMLHELHHTDARDYKEALKQRFDLIEALRAKIQRVPG